MGFNTTVLVQNDALGAIENDTEFGKKLSNAIGMLSLRMHDEHGVDISSGGNVNAATVLETHHADNIAIVAVGGNYATMLHQVGGRISHHKVEDQEKLLKEWADKLGFRLVKKSVK